MNEVDFFLLSVVLGQGMTFATDYINRYIPNSQLRFWVSVGTCLLVGIIMNYDQLAWSNRQQIFSTFMTIWFSAQAAYKTYYEGSQFQYKIRRPVFPEAN